MRHRKGLLLTLCLLAVLAVLEGALPAAAELPAADSWPHRILLPLVSHTSERTCAPIPGQTYYAIPVAGMSPDPGIPAERHPDLNLNLRGYSENTIAYRGLVDYGGAYDVLAPRLQDIFADGHWPGIARVYRVYQWDGQWPGVYGIVPITSPDVTLAGLNASAGEILHVPSRPAEIYHDTLTGRHYVAMVLYAAPDRITLKYTRDDHVITGYTIHIEGICVEPGLLALYRTLEASGRTHLPGLLFGQAIGRAVGSEVGVAIRDTGTFMDPRSRKDWWQGLTLAGVDILSLDASGEEWFQAQQQRLDQGTVENEER